MKRKIIEASHRFPKLITNPRIMNVCSARISNILVKTKHERLFNTIRVDRQSKSYKETCSLVTKAIRVGCGGGGGGQEAAVPPSWIKSVSLGKTF